MPDPEPAPHDRAASRSRQEVSALFSALRATYADDRKPPPAVGKPVDIGDFISRLLKLDDALRELPQSEREWLQGYIRQGSGFVKTQGSVLVRLGHMLGIEIDTSRIPGYEEGSTRDVARPMAEPEPKTVRELADTLGMPEGALKAGIDAGAVVVDMQSASRFAAAYKRVEKEPGVTDAELQAELGLSASEMKRVRQALESVGDGNERHRIYNRTYRAKHGEEYRAADRERKRRERAASKGTGEAASER